MTNTADLLQWLRYKADKARSYLEECKQSGRLKEAEFTTGEIHALYYVINYVQGMEK